MVGYHINNERWMSYGDGKRKNIDVGLSAELAEGDTIILKWTFEEENIINDL